MMCVSLMNLAKEIIRFHITPADLLEPLPPFPLEGERQASIPLFPLNPIFTGGTLTVWTFSICVV